MLILLHVTFQIKTTYSIMGREHKKYFSFIIFISFFFVICTDKQLVIFLNCCQCHLERTKKMIDNYYTIRTHSPEMFANKNILEFQKTFDI